MAICLGALFGIFLSYANGANDNFKGVATLWADRSVSYRQAILWGTVTTALGALASLYLAQKLMGSFSGKGLVPDQILTMKAFAFAVVGAASITVFLASRLGFPISTTHALTGALVGAGLMAPGHEIHLSALSKNFVVPLVFGPVIAIIGASLFHRVWRLLPSPKKDCLCLEEKSLQVTVTSGLSGNSAAAFSTLIEHPVSVPFPIIKSCEGEKAALSSTRFSLRLDLSRLRPSLHFLSAGLLSFARGLNDTPKIAALFILGTGLDPRAAVATVTVCMAMGGLWSAKRVADTMAHKIASLDTDQALSANLLTSSIVLLASVGSLPVSTTHVSCGSIFGIGLSGRQVQWRMVWQILIAWLTTLPVAILLGIILFRLLR